MGVIVIILLIALFVGYVYINSKISNLKYRAKQEMLKNTGFSSSDINAKISGGLEKKQLQKFLASHPNYTEESIKELLKQYSSQLIQKNAISEFSKTVCEKLEKDSKLEKMQKMELKRANINSYSNSKIIALVVYTDNKDEYNIYLYCSIVEEKIQLDKYQIMKGSAVGL